MIAVIDQVYSHVDGLDLRFDIFRPDSEDVVPAVVCLHGGGWISGSKEDARELAVRLARQGFAAACPDYRLAPLHPCPAAIEDARSFTAYLRSHAQEWSIDPDRIASLGNSAGGHLALMVGLAKEPSERANAIVDVCGITDLTRPAEQHFAVSWGFLEQFMGCAYDGHEVLWQEASPLWNLDAKLPPCCVIHGADDDVVPVAQSDVFVGAARKLGCEVEYLRIPEEDHSFSGGSFGMIERGYVSFLSEKLDRLPA